MRMWNVNPNVMCRKHLLGEHVEMHMFVGHMQKGRKTEGFHLDARRIVERHDRLALEMENRGYKHQSPLTNTIVREQNNLPTETEDLNELCRRCEACKRLIEKDKTPVK